MAKIHRKRMMTFFTVFLGMMTALAPLSTDMYIAGLPLMTGDFGVGTSMIQLTLTLSMAGMAIGQICIGPISDDVGRKTPMLAGMAVFTASSVGCVFATSIYAFLAFRFIQGFSGGACIVIARAIARDISSGATLTKLFSMLMLVNGIAPVFAPPIGGFIIEAFTWRHIFIFLSVIGLILLATTFTMPETLHYKAVRRGNSLIESLKSYPRLFSNSYFMGHCLMQCLAFAAFFGYIAASSFVFQNIFHVSPQGFSIIFGINGLGLLISSLITNRLAGRIGDWLALKGYLIMAVLGSALLLAGFWFSWPFYAIVVILFLTVSTLAPVSTLSFSMAMQAQGRNAGSASALIGFFSMISGAVMAPVVGIAGSYTAIPMGLVMVFGEVGAFLSYIRFIAPHHRNKG